MLSYLTPLFLTQLLQISAQCIDELGQNVDWIVMYKLPKHSEAYQHDSNFINEGKS